MACHRGCNRSHSSRRLGLSCLCLDNDARMWPPEDRQRHSRHLAPEWTSERWIRVSHDAVQGMVGRKLSHTGNTRTDKEAIVVDLILTSG